MSSPSLTIGIPYRDEGQNFALLAGGLIASLAELPDNLSWEVLFCVNGSDTDVPEKLAAMAVQCGFAEGQFRVITSAEGKLAAQRTIVKERRSGGFIAFVDSDVVIERPVLRLLWETLAGDPECMVAYGQPVPIFPEQPNFLHHFLRVHYSLRERAYHRPYFHGRAFMLREWFFDEPPPLAEVKPSVAARLRLERGPLVDDIAMSRMVAARWGHQAIREVQKANVHFDPPDTLAGMYAASFRVALELERLNWLYPHHALVQKSVTNHSWNGHNLARYSKRLRNAHAVYRLLEKSLKRVARLHVWLVKSGVLRVDTLWIRVPGTKNFARHRLAWKSFKGHDPAPAQKHSATDSKHPPR